jgi:hypothetical protein
MKRNDPNPSGHALRALQALSEQNAQTLSRSLSGLSPSVSHLIQDYARSAQPEGYARLASEIVGKMDTRRIIGEALDQVDGRRIMGDAFDRMDTSRMIGDALAQAGTSRIIGDALAQIDTRRIIGDALARSQFTMTDVIRDTIRTIDARQASSNAKLAAAGILGHQAALARVRLPQPRLRQITSDTEWRRLSKRFANQALESLSIAGLDATRELQRIREAAGQERKRAREELRSDGRTAAADDVGLEDLPRLLDELMSRMASLTKALHGRARSQNLALLLAVITLIYTVLADHVEPFMPKPAPAPRAQPSKPRSKARPKTKSAAKKPKAPRGKAATERPRGTARRRTK